MMQRIPRTYVYKALDPQPYFPPPRGDHVSICKRTKSLADPWKVPYAPHSGLERYAFCMLPRSDSCTC
ncbi:hypothetical protein VTO58DRAFT_102201 [Aureobasidium pullulans]